MVFSPFETTTRAVTSAMKRGNHRVKPHCTKTAYSVFVQIAQLGRHFAIVIDLGNYVCKNRASSREAAGRLSSERWRVGASALVLICSLRSGAWRGEC